MANGRIDENGLPVYAPGDYDFVRVVDRSTGASRNALAPDVTTAARELSDALGQVVADAEADIAPVIAGLGYLPPVPYASGLNVNSTRFTVIRDGQAYAPAAPVPFTTGSWNASQWRLIQGVTGADLSAESGAAMLGFRQAGSGAVLRNLLSKSRESISVADFGALGNGDQTLQPTNYSVNSVTISQQTHDGACINNALKYLRSIGGGALYFPKGVYRVYGYLEAIDFPVTIHGDGPGVTVIANCDSSPTDRNGYGVFHCQPEDEEVANITFRGITVDGKAEDREAPTSEWRSYPIAPMGNGFYTLDNVHLINSPIDCLRTGFANDSPGTGLVATNCKLSNSFRNTLSCVSGWNQSWTNCIIEKGGRVHGGTNPRFCLDIEPVNSSNPIRGLRFNSCVFSDARNVIAGGSWGEATFMNCKFEAPEQGPGGLSYPWLVNFQYGHYDLVGCRFSGPPSRRGLIQASGVGGNGGIFEKTQYLRLVGCSVEGAGFLGIGPSSILENTEFLNSTMPVSAFRSSAGVNSLVVKNVRLVNVLDAYNIVSGALSSFSTTGTTRGPIYIDGLSIEVDPDAIPSDMIEALQEREMLYGIYLRVPSSLNENAESKITNVHVKGFYQRLPEVLGKVPNAANFRDWGVPNTAPADSSGQTTAPQTHYYRNCTMLGDNP